jgi:hypothetical protein
MAERSARMLVRSVTAMSADEHGAPALSQARIMPNSASAN